MLRKSSQFHDNQVRSCPPAPGHSEVLVPGQWELKEAEKRKVQVFPKSFSDPFIFTTVPGRTFTTWCVEWFERSCVATSSRTWAAISDQGLSGQKSRNVSFFANLFLRTSKALFSQITENGPNKRFIIQKQMWIYCWSKNTKKEDDIPGSSWC